MRTCSFCGKKLTKEESHYTESYCFCIECKTEYLEEKEKRKQKKRLSST